MKTYAADPRLKEHLQRLRKEIEICKTSNVGCIRLVVFDKRGRWAAMAVGQAFAEVALRSQSLTLTKVSFLMHYLETDCSGCDACVTHMVDLYEAAVDIMNSS